MEYSYEEIYERYGQFDPIVHIGFKVNSQAHQKYAYQLFGTILYTHDERKTLQEIVDKTPKEEFPRTHRMVRFRLSPVQELDAEKVQQLEQFGFQCSDIFYISDNGSNRRNRFIEKGEKEIIAQTYEIEVDGEGWSYKSALKALHNQLNRRLEEGHQLAPFEQAEILAFRKVFEMDNSVEPYKSMSEGKEEDIDFYYLKNLQFILINDPNVKPEDLNEDNFKDYTNALVDRIVKKAKFIDSEIERSGEKVKNLSVKYKTEIDNLKRETIAFDGESFNIRGKMVYLTFEGLVHIYARHVKDMYVQGQRADGAKTFFQYKVEDILKILRINIDSLKEEINAHFAAKPDKRFFRKDSRSTYYDGHYYRIDIDPDGNIAGFHPYNNNGREEELI